MQTMYKRQCANCEGTLQEIRPGVWECKYCGTQYRYDDPYSLIQPVVIKTGYKVMKTRLSVANELFEVLKDDAEDYIKRQIVRSFENYMLEHFDEMFDYFSEENGPYCQRDYVARLRYIDDTTPNWRADYE